MAPAVPGVEVADHRDTRRHWAPRRRSARRARRRPSSRWRRARGELEVAAFGEQMQVEVAEQRAEAVGILGLLLGVRPVMRSR